MGRREICESLQLLSASYAAASGAPLRLKNCDFSDETVLNRAANLPRAALF